MCQQHLHQSNFYTVYFIDCQHILICNQNCKQYDLDILIFGPKLILSDEGIKTHSKSSYYMNGAFKTKINSFFKVSILLFFRN